MFFGFFWRDSSVHSEKNVNVEIKLVQSRLLFSNYLSTQFCFPCTRNIPVSKLNVKNHILYIP
jgi:hypothetical protein